MLSLKIDNYLTFGILIFGAVKILSFDWSLSLLKTVGK